MATALNVVTRAARKRLRESGMTLTATELTDGLADLNDMLAGWANDGIDIAHVTLVSGDTLDVPDDHIQTIILSLAERLTDFGGELDRADILRAEEGRMALRAYHFSIASLGSDHPLAE